MSSLSVGQVLKALEARAPSSTAERWDNVGLLVGDSKSETHSVVVSIDLTQQAVEKAKALGAKLIVNHHPCIFPRQSGLNRVTAEGGSLSPLVFECIKNGISVIASHTNFDKCALEVASAVSQSLGVQVKGRLHDSPPAGSTDLIKLVVFVPESHAQKVREAVTNAGAGHVGHYDCCTFSSMGTGTFRGNSQTQPFLGVPGELEVASEVRFETVFPRGMERVIVNAMRLAHPYEEVAYDLVPVTQGPTPQGVVRGLGYGFWGDFEVNKSFPQLLEGVSQTFQVRRFWVTENPPATVKRVGFVAGKGASFLGSAKAQGCDVFITGEAGYHVALEGARAGMAVIELGHRESEYYFVKTMAAWLKSENLSVVELNSPTQSIFSLGDPSK